MPCVVTSTAAYCKVLSSMENALMIVNSLLPGSFLLKFSSLSAPTKIEELIMLEIAAKCSNYAKN